MKRTWKVAAAVVLIGGGLWTGSLLNLKAEGAGVTNQPGTADDPVVTKSYVDQQIQQALKGGGGSTTTPTAPPTPSTGGSDSSATEDMKIVDVKPGQILIASAGTEFIVRAGKAVVYSEDKNGISDLTDGKDIIGGNAVVNNHLLLFPREGRGIQVKEGDTHNLTVIVRGGYQIK
ncbi:hypothetical protein [Paenibacillus segetis]|uniref:Uncharacterized protein n=1 Tax=Paenibacillus segetis TaxID=1325360 RepID=A0ABQ1YPE2_9BACL|nr:hypothetical protein [Paenibacillus segetis]GGH32901.1 hypothetical protein GCM10008013_37600 [Paenibacillus segetis]